MCYLCVLKVDPASCLPSEVKNFEMAPVILFALIFFRSMSTTAVAEGNKAGVCSREFLELRVRILVRACASLICCVLCR